VSYEFFRVGFVTAFKNHSSSNLLAPLLVRNTKHGRLSYCRVSSEGIFDFSGEYVETTRDNHVFLPVDDVQIALLIYFRDVTGVDPAVDNRLGGKIFSLPITLHRTPTTHAQFTRLTDFGLLAGRGKNTYVDGFDRFAT